MELLNPRFQFEPFGAFDPTSRYYVYTEDPSGHNIHGLVSRDLKTGATNILLPARLTLVPRIFEFHDDSIFYISGKALWKTALDGSGSTQIFPNPHLDSGRQ